MTHSLRFTWGPLLAAAVALGAAPRAALAAPAHNVCVPPASGVPTREGPPKWEAWTAADVVDHSLDDPRWLGASGHSFEYGSATAPLHSRAVWSHEGTQDFLYLSFVVDLEPTDATPSPGATSPRDVFLGFHRVTPVGGELGYVFQFHLDGAAAGTNPWVSPTHCGTYGSCDETSGTPKNYWRVFADHGNSGTCGTTGHTGEKYERLVGATASDPPFAWMTNAADPSHDAVLYWKLGSTGPLQNRWAVQIRIPMVDAGHPISEGVEKGATFFYEATAQVAGAGGGDYISIGRWPRELATAICPMTSLQDFVVHEELGSNAACTACSVDKFSRLTEEDLASPPADCDGGISIDHGDVGAVFDAAAGTDFSTVTPTNAFKAYRTDGTAAPNTVIAQPHNTTSAAITAPLMARFRLASWGAAPWSTPDTGKWKDIRGSGTGVCGAVGASPGTCGPMTIPANGKGAITFQWQLGNDTGADGLGNSEYCQFGLTPPTGWACGACTCAGSEAGTDATKKCYADADAGTQATHIGLSPGPCVSTVYQYDQCMLVDLSAPNGTVDFVRQSTWNNMQFATMSVDMREALIDGRGLPVGPGQKFQDIYLIAMPRNMPHSVPAGTTGTTLVQQGTLEVAAAIATPYLDDMKHLTPEQIRAIADKLGHQIGDVHSRDERVLAIWKARAIMPDADYQRVGRLVELAVAQGGKAPADQLTHAIYEHTDPATTAAIVPTLEIYAYYLPLDKGHAYQPMTSFSMFLSHEGGLGGIDWEIDGAKKVAGNVYHLRIPVGRARRIRLRSQALVPPEVKQAPGNPSWPCGGCACNRSQCGTIAGINSMAPGILAGVFVFGRRRKRKPGRKARRPRRGA
jgi:hypothetical protein